MRNCVLFRKEYLSPFKAVSCFEYNGYIYVWDEQYIENEHYQYLFIADADTYDYVSYYEYLVKDNGERKLKKQLTFAYDLDQKNYPSGYTALKEEFEKESDHGYCTVTYVFDPNQPSEKKYSLRVPIGSNLRLEEDPEKSDYKYYMDPDGTIPKTTPWDGLLDRTVYAIKK